MCQRLRPLFLNAVLVAVLLGLVCTPAHAYIGPGAGFAFISSFFVMFFTFFLAVLSLLFWPLRYVFRKVRSRKRQRPLVDRVVVLGLDGLSPEIVQNLMQKGCLPNFARLKEQGYFSPLKTTNPPISPVAWSSFQTGVSPGKHNIFDFLGRDPKTYLPVLSFSKLGKARRTLTLGTYVIPLSKPSISLQRKSKPFWEILGEHDVFSTILRVPVTFPPQKFRGHVLAAMGAPDLKGSQGTFTFYSTNRGAHAEHTGGVQVFVKKEGNTVESYISGPDNPFLKEPTEMRIPFRIDCAPGEGEATLRVNGKRYTLKKGEYSEWVPLCFKPFPGVKIRGIGRFLVRSIAPEFSMYLTPINIDPEQPAMPLSHPLVYSIYLAKLLGSYATLGEAEDTWALNEKVISEDDFLKQCWLIYEERKKMFFQALNQTRKGLCACVFDTSDRVQHMFWRKNEGSASSGEDRYAAIIEDLYRKMDGLIGEVLERITDQDILFVLSDHGIKSFRRCFNLNTWLHKNGYLSLKNEQESKDFFANVDWGTTRAFGVGMAGLYVNQKGREQHGVVQPGEESDALIQELRARLCGLKDETTGETAVLHVYDSRAAYTGPYSGNGPDLVIGCNDGYRVSWDSVIGKPGEAVFEDNTKSWQADHCVDTELVPGILFCNRKITASEPEIIDLAPTILSLFGVPVPQHVDGKALNVKI